MERLAAVVLAAGASTRMGRPKALLQWRGRPFVYHAVEQARAAAADPIVVVQGAVTIPRPLLGPLVQLIHHEAWADGPLGSLQAGLRALDQKGEGPGAVLVLTVDRPHVKASTLRALARAFRATPEAIWQPAMGGRRGHPLIYPAIVSPSLVQLCDPQTPRTLLAQPQIAARRRLITVDDPGILDNLDCPADLQRLPPEPKG